MTEAPTAAGLLRQAETLFGHFCQGGRGPSIPQILAVAGVCEAALAVARTDLNREDASLAEGRVEYYRAMARGLDRQPSALTPDWARWYRGMMAARPALRRA